MPLFLKAKRLSFLLLPIMLTACAHSPAHQSLRAEFQSQTATLTLSPPKDFWLDYQLPALAKAIEALPERNFELLSLQKNIELARLATQNLTNIPNWNAGLSASDNRQLAQQKSHSQSFAANIGASYELDLWQKLKNTQNSSELRARASEFDWQSARLSQVRALISTYFAYSSGAAELKLLNQQQQNLQKIHQINQLLTETGKADVSLTAQSQSNLLSTQSRQQELFKQQQDNANSLRQLLQLAVDAPLPFEPVDILTIPLKDPLSAPVYVIGSRPDLLAAAYNARAANLDLDQQYKNWFPQISINAGISSSAAHFADLGSNPLAALGLNIQLPFLNHGTLSRAKKQQQLQAEQAMLNFAKLYHSALLEIANRQNGFKSAQAQFVNASEQWALSKIELEKSTLRYQSGKTDLGTFLAAQNQYLSAQIALLQSRGAQLAAHLEWMLALG